MSAITILKENIPQGPFSRSEVADRLGRGEFTLDSLAFVDGLTQWTPLREVLVRVDGAAPPPAMPPASVTAAAARPVDATRPPTAAPTPVSAPVPAPAPSGYSYAATMQPPTHLVYAGFWMRFVALLIDFLILSPLFLIFAGIDFLVGETNDTSLKIAGSAALFVVWLFVAVGQWLYFALQESSAAQATLGKRLIGIQVTTRQGTRIGFGRATGRYFGKIISQVILCVGFMLAGWTQRKQALHDMLADTLVVRKPGA